MIWLAVQLILLPFRIVSRTVKLTVATIRFVGVGRLVFLGIGVLVGKATATTDGAGFRARIEDLLGPAAGNGGPATGRSTLLGAPKADVGESVRHELAHSPRTWHLPQPTVTVEGTRVTLTGAVPHETGRVDLGRVAGAVHGVTALDNRVTVEP